MGTVQNHLQNAAHFVGVAYPPNRFPCKSVHSCKHDSHFCMKICLALNSYKKIMIAISSKLYYNSVCRRISPSKILLTNPLLIIYTPLERPDSSPVRSFFFPVFMRLPGLGASQKVSVYSTQKMLRLFTFYNLFLIEILILFFVTDVLFKNKIYILTERTIILFGFLFEDFNNV